MSKNSRDRTVEREIRRRIAEHGSLPFREFMELALYHPGAGYYMRAGATTGPGGDFATSSDVSPAFGGRLAVQAQEVHERTGSGNWQLVELGPGRGHLALDLLDGLARHAPASLEALDRLVLVETSPSLAAQQLDRIAGRYPRLCIDQLPSLNELPGRSISGFVYGNEFLDALPVELVERTEDGLVSVHVEEADAGRLKLCPGPSVSSELRSLVERYELCTRTGDRVELCPSLDGIVSAVGRALRIGAAAFIDYGHTKEVLGDELHREGTLVAYSQHNVAADLLAQPGCQDLTAHVNWSHLEDAAIAAGLKPAGRVRQSHFLLALGLADDLVASSPHGRETPSETMRRLAARRLVMPGPGGGQRFEVALFVRGIGADLAGLRTPRDWIGR